MSQTDTYSIIAEETWSASAGALLESKARTSSPGPDDGTSLKSHAGPCWWSVIRAGLEQVQLLLCCGRAVN